MGEKDDEVRRTDEDDAALERYAFTGLDDEGIEQMVCEAAREMRRQVGTEGVEALRDFAARLRARGSDDIAQYAPFIEETADCLEHNVARLTLGQLYLVGDARNEMPVIMWRAIDGPAG